MRKNPWLRFFLSYLFIFLFLTLSLVVIFLFVIGENASKEARNANQVYARNVLNTFDDVLRNTDQTIIRELLTNTKLQAFFNSDTADETFTLYQVYTRLREMTSTIDGVDSVYLYRVSDNRVLSESSMFTLADFEDKAFIESWLAHPGQKEWSSPRAFTPVEGSQSQQVVSLVKGIPLGTTGQGLVVVNLLAYPLQQMLEDIAQSELHYAYFSDAELKPVFSLRTEEPRVLTSYTSDTTGWTLHAGVVNRKVGSFLSLLSYSWLLFMALAVLFGIMLLFIVFRKNYKPISAISNRIQYYIHKERRHWEGDQFAFIESSVEKLILQSQQYEEQAAKDLSLKRSYFFRELITGTQHVSLMDWKHEIQSLGLSDSYKSFLVILIEIDDYSVFNQTYNSRDQLLLKFALRSAVQEVSEHYAVSFWIDWFANNRLCNLILLDEENTDIVPGTIQMCEELRAWVENHLRFTVTIGIGDVVDHLPSIPHSYEVANERLEIKVSTGNNRVISQETHNPQSSAIVYDQLEYVRSMTHRMIILNETWKQEYRRIFVQLKRNFSSRKTILNLVEYMLYHINSEMSELSQDIKSIWHTEILPKLNKASKSFDTLEQLEDDFYAALAELEQHIATKRKSSPHYHNVDAIKAYIDHHYSDPNLSLNQISEHFQISPSQFSTIFKAISGEKFIDYLTKVRIDQAKRLLDSTEDSVQDIALLVGYNHAFSFIRVFKKSEGLPPGKYRKSKSGA